MVVADRFLILDFHNDPFTGADVRHRGGEDIWTFLFQQARPFPFLLGLLIDLLGFASFLNLAFDDPLTHVHAQVIDGGRLREREDIDAFPPVDFLLTGIGELLAYLGAGDDARDGNLHVGAQDRRSGIAARLVGFEQQRSFRHVADPHRRHHARAERFSWLRQQHGWRNDQGWEHCEPGTEA